GRPVVEGQRQVFLMDALGKTRTDRETQKQQTSCRTSYFAFQKFHSPCTLTASPQMGYDKSPTLLCRKETFLCRKFFAPPAGPYSPRQINSGFAATDTASTSLGKVM